MSLNKDLLITGAHRTGTTWVGNILNKSENVELIMEPFNIENKLFLFNNDKWFPHVTARNEKKFEKSVEKIINKKVPIGKFLNLNLKNKKSFLINNYKLLRARVLSRNIILKDPIALFAAEWLYKKYSMIPIVLIRHPAAFISSLKKNNWEFDFSHFASQESLIEGPLKPFKSKIKKAARIENDIIDQGILLWNCFYYHVNQLNEKYDDWVFIKHENISKNPISSFKKVFEKFALPFTSKIVNHINKTTNKKNVVERSAENVHELKRNSEKNIFVWKKRLTNQEISRIKKGCDNISSKFYLESAWEK